MFFSKVVGLSKVLVAIRCFAGFNIIVVQCCLMHSPLMVNTVVLMPLGIKHYCFDAN